MCLINLAVLHVDYTWMIIEIKIGFPVKHYEPRKRKYQSVFFYFIFWILIDEALYYVFDELNNSDDCKMIKWSNSWEIIDAFPKIVNVVQIVCACRCHHI